MNQRPWTYYCFYLLPKNSLSRFAGWVASQRLPKPMLHWLLRTFVKRFNVNMDESALPLTAFPTFNEFFTRQLKPGLRPVDPHPQAIVSPVDGIIGPHGTIEQGRLIQAKGLDYTLAELLDDPLRARNFEGGEFLTIYLAPYHYHRIHAMISGKISRATYVPGRLWTVSPVGVNHVKDLFSKNERLNNYLDSPRGTAVLIMVGATVVGKIKVRYHSIESNLKNSLRQEILLDVPFAIEKGEEIGRFELGSTVILLFPPNTMNWQDLQAGQDIRLGQKIGSWK